MPRSDRLRAAIELQGYRGLSDRVLLQLDPWLRIAPAFCAGWTAVATAMGSSRALGLLAAICAVGVVTPVHPFDMPYQFVFRFWLKGRPLASTPRPRRFATAVGSASLAVTALAFASGSVRLGVGLGVLCTLIALVPVTTGLCIPSWVWSRVWRRRHTPGWTLPGPSS